MAIDSSAVVSIQLEDGRNEITTYDQPFGFDSAVATLAGIISWAQGLALAVDLITDSKVTKIRVSILIPLPSGLSSGKPVAGADNEKTGLTTFNVFGINNNAYGDDIPAIPNAVLTGNQINQSNTNWLAWKAYLTTGSGGIQATDRYGNLLGAVKHAVLTFRKHRRALRRA